MNQILTATYRDGTLILSEKLDPSLEGQAIDIMIMTPETSDTRLAIWEKEKAFIQNLNRTSEGRDWKREDLYDRFESKDPD